MHTPSWPSAPASAARRLAPTLLRLLAVAATIALCLALGACGGSSSPSASAASERAKEHENEVKFTDFARCLREHGIEAKAETRPGGGFGLRVGGPGGARGPVSPERMEAAQNACKKYRPEPKKVNLSPQQKIELEERVQKFAKCMREHGIKVELSTRGGGVQIGIHHFGSGGPNPESPAFQAAQKACQGLLPFKGKGGPFGGPGG